MSLIRLHLFIYSIHTHMWILWPDTIIAHYTILLLSQIVSYGLRTNEIQTEAQIKHEATISS